MQRSNYICYTTDFLSITMTGSYAFNCNDLVFLNQGIQNVTINGILVLGPGQGWSFAGYPGEMNISSYDITFANDRENGCDLVIMQKQYASPKPENLGES